MNIVVRATLEREADYIREKSTTCEAEATINTKINQITHDATIPTFTGKNATHLKHQFDTQVRYELKKHMSLVKKRRKKSEDSFCSDIKIKNISKSQWKRIIKSKTQIAALKNVSEENSQREEEEKIYIVFKTMKINPY